MKKGLTAPRPGTRTNSRLVAFSGSPGSFTMRLLPGSLGGSGMAIARPAPEIGRIGNRPKNPKEASSLVLMIRRWVVLKCSVNDIFGDKRGTAWASWDCFEL